MFRIIEPEVAGGMGSETQLDNTVHPPLVKRLHFEFEGWLGDDILETFPCFLVTESLKNKIQNENLTGIAFNTVLITKSSNFITMYPDKSLPKFYWAQIKGSFGKTDFFLGPDKRLVISEKSFLLLSQFQIKNALIELMN